VRAQPIKDIDMNHDLCKQLRRVTAMGAFVVSGAIVTAMGEDLKNLNADLSPSAWPIDPFVLTDHHGNAFTREHLEGRWTFVVFGNTHCAPPCGAPLGTLARVAQLLAKSQAARTTQFLFVSVDPERDSTERLRDYVEGFNAGLIGARGSHPTLGQLTQEMSASYRLVEHRNGGEAAQADTTIRLIGPDDLLRAEFFPPYDAQALTAAYLRMRLCRRGSAQ
jgi:protein SCO1